MEVNNKLDDFFQNKTIESGHTEKIDNIQITQNGQYLVSTSKELVKVWQIHPEMKCLLEVNVDETQQEVSDRKILATLDNDCTQLIVFEGACLHIKRY